MKVYVVGNSYSNDSFDLLHVFDSTEKVYNFVSPYMDDYYSEEDERKRLLETYNASNWEECKLHMVQRDDYTPLDDSYNVCITWIETELE